MIKIGSQIKLNNKINGTVKYIGKLENKEGTWIGLELDEPSGRNSGSINNKSYFECKKNHGMFIKKDLLDSKLHKLTLEKDPYTEEMINYEYENGVQKIIKESLYTSQIENKKTENLKKEIKLLKRQLEIEKNLKKKIKMINDKLVEKIETFKFDFGKIIDEIAKKLDLLKIPQPKVIEDENEYFKLCESFKNILLSSVENNTEKLEKNLKVYYEIIKKIRN